MSRLPIHPAIVPGRTGWSIGPVSGLLRRRWLVAVLVVLAIGVATTLVGLLTGRLAIPIGDVVPALVGSGERADVIVVARRASRAVLALLVGIALGVAGAITQSLTRNPLASPDILGVSAGAGVGAVAVITLQLPDAVVGLAVPTAALAGAAATTALVLWLSWRRGLDTMRLVITGVAISAIGLALTDLLLLRSGTEEAAVAARWLAGSLEGASWRDVRLLAPAVLVGLVAVAVGASALAALRLGPDVARTTGVPVARAQLGLVVLAVVLVAVATAAAGPIGFVAFVAPQIAMRLMGTAGPPMLAGGIVGGVLVILADQLAQALPFTLPVGVVTSLLGGPIMLAVVARSLRSTSA